MQNSYHLSGKIGNTGQIDLHACLKDVDSATALDPLGLQKCLTLL